jgi:hypothetical protein
VKSSWRWLSFSAVLSIALMSGCGENGEGCAAPPEKKDDSGGGGAGGGGKLGGGGGGGDIVISEKKSKKVPKPYQRQPGEAEASAPAAGAGAAAPNAAGAAPAGASASSSTMTARGLPVMRVTRRKVDGISNRVEVKCRVMASSADGECSSAPNYEEIKQKCCPGGIVERCQVGMRGVVLIGLDCEKKTP